jgi:hypothetical protein
MPSEQADAWIGDAVLLLYARERVLREDGKPDGERCARMTSNQFLSAVGEPTAVEARLGRVYRKEGLAAAYAWIEEHLAPVYARQEAKRKAGAARRGGVFSGVKRK